MMLFYCNHKVFPLQKYKKVLLKGVSEFYMHEHLCHGRSQGTDVLVKSDLNQSCLGRF